MSVVDHEYCQPDLKLSNYVLKLNSVGKQRYVEKLTIKTNRGAMYILKDPYTLSKDEWSTDMKYWPNVEYPDIVNFLTGCPGDFTAKCLKNYKSLSAYEYVVSGKVGEVLTYNPPGVNYLQVLSAEVHPSQRLNEANYQTWVLVEKNGKIETAHCTCVAGLGEACSHIAAVLFKVEKGVRLGLNRSAPTDESCRWNSSFSKKVKKIPVAEMDFGRSRWKCKGVLDQIERKTSLPQPSTSKMAAEKLQDLKNIAPNAVFKTLTYSGSDSDTDTASESENVLVPPSITELIKQMDSNNLEIELTNFFSEELCSEIEKRTRGQQKNEMWFKQRCGRVTSSLFGELMKRKTWTPLFIQKFLTKNRCPAVKAIEWGIKKEKLALQAYIEKAKRSHSDFHVLECGLFVRKDMPYLGASPDAVVSCSCCGNGLVEIKCPYKHRTVSPFVAAKNDKQFCLNENFYIKENHSYFFQIQGQLLITKLSYCDFAVWTPIDISITRVRSQTETQKRLQEVLKNFFFKAIVPAVCNEK